MGGGSFVVRVPRALRRAARRELSDALGIVVAGQVIGEADLRFVPLAAEIPGANHGASHLLRMSAYAVALFRSLTDHRVATEDAQTLVSNAVFAAVRPGRDAVARLGRIRHRDPLRGARWASDLARRFYYAEPGWHIEDVAVDDGFGMDVTRCVIAEYFDRHGESELCQRAICDQDVRSASRHGLSLVRSGTLAGGSDRCGFRYHLSPNNEKNPFREPSMREVSDTVHIDAPPERVWAWLTALAEHYTQWHPDHVSARWERGMPNRVGSALCVVEYLGGHRERLRFEVTEVTPPHTLRYRVLGLHSMLLPDGAFTITQDDGGSSFTANIRYRFGTVTQRIFRQRMEALQTHMREEGENLKQLLETAP